DDKHYQDARADRGCRHHTDIDQRIAASKLPRNHQHESQRANRHRNDNESRREPVVLEAAVERELERAEKGCDQYKADEVEAVALLQEALALGERGASLAQQRANEPERNHADRAVDEEAPLPGKIIREPATARRSDHRGYDHGDAEQRKTLAALFRRKRASEDRLRHRHHAAAAESLHDTEQQQRLQIGRETAQYRACGEQREAEQEEGLAAKAPGKI